MFHCLAAVSLALIPACFFGRGPRISVDHRTKTKSKGRLAATRSTAAIRPPGKTIGPCGRRPAAIYCRDKKRSRASRPRLRQRFPLRTFLGELVVGRPLRLPVRFEINRATIRPQSFPYLDKLVELLKREPLLALEIRGHTDHRSVRWRYSSNITKRRARSVRHYLIVKGIPPNRLRAKGYGASQPVTRGRTAKGRAMNRRIEIVALQRTP